MRKLFSQDVPRKHPLRIVEAALSLWFLCAFPQPFLFAESPPNPDKYLVKAVRITRNIELTGKLSDPLWNLAVPLDLKYEIYPGENTPANEQTFVRVLYNSDYIYFGIDCRDTTAKSMRAHLTDRDQMLDDDFVGILIDTYGTMQGGYEFFVNPFGIQADAMRTGNNEDFSFDCVWTSYAEVNDSGYTAEVAVPFKSLRFPSSPEQHWVLNIVRTLPRDSRYQMAWTTIDKNNPCILCQSGRLEGIEGISSSNNVEILPYAMGIQSGSVHDADDPNSRFSNGPVTGRVGTGIKYSPSSTFALSGVLNPDFGEVESDATQISINNTFAIFYPEKRPFFLEGTELFGTAAQVFYSRMINDPLVSTKITEKAGSFSVAYLGAEDRQSPFIIPGEENSDFVSSSLKSWTNILRGKYDLGKESFVGGLVTTRNFASAYNYVGTVDWNILFGGNYYLKGQAGGSTTKEINDTSLFSSERRLGSTPYTASLDGERYTGSGFQVDITRNGRNYSFDFGVVNVTPTFQAQDGFITSTGFRQYTFFQDYTVYFENSFFENASVQTNSALMFNYDGVRKSVGSSVKVQANMKGQTYAYVSYYPLDDEVFHGVQFRNLYRTEAYVSMKPHSSVAFNVWAQVGRLVYRTDTPELGRGFNMSAQIILKPTDRFSLDFAYAHSRLWSSSSRALFFDGSIARGVVVYQLSPGLFARLISQYNRFDNQLQVDPLISYKLKPFTVFYLGSTHNFTKFDEPYGITRTVQQFFVKLQYLWQS